MTSDILFIVSKARLLQLEDEFHYLQNTNSTVTTTTNTATAPIADGLVIDVEGTRK